MKISLKYFIITAVIAALLFTGTGVTSADASGSWQGQDGNPFCEDPDRIHPVGAAIAETYDTTYDQIMEWFCGTAAGGDGDAAPYQTHGLGQVMLALQTAENTGNSGEAQRYLDQRREGRGWGQIWQEAGLIGKDRLREQGKPDHAGPPENKGKPDHAGPKDKPKQK